MKRAPKFDGSRLHDLGGTNGAFEPSISPPLISSGEGLQDLALADDLP
jgi:hypothetical protein